MMPVASFYLLAVLTAAAAYCFAVVLIEPGMLLYPVYSWLYTRLERTGSVEARWWWKPFWGCFKCVAGQWAFWSFLYLCWRWAWPYDPGLHLGYTALVILLTLAFDKWLNN